MLRGDLDISARACPRAPWLALLVRAGIRRLDALLTAFAGATPRYAELPSMVDVEVEGQLSRWRGSRYSRRQAQRFPLDGLVGRAVARGEAMHEVGALLRVLELTSVGKATSMGFGALSAEPLP